MSSFLGLPHRYEIFLKKKGITFVNDSKATSLEAANLPWLVVKIFIGYLADYQKIRTKLISRYIKIILLNLI